MEQNNRHLPFVMRIPATVARILLIVVGVGMAASGKSLGDALSNHQEVSEGLERMCQTELYTEFTSAAFDTCMLEKHEVVEHMKISGSVIFLMGIALAATGGTLLAASKKKDAGPKL